MFYISFLIKAKINIQFRISFNNLSYNQFDKYELRNSRKDKFNLEFYSCEVDLFSEECTKDYLLDSYN